MPDPSHLTLPGQALEQLAEGRRRIADAWMILARDRGTPVDLVLQFRELTEHAARVEEMLQVHVEPLPAEDLEAIAALQPGQAVALGGGAGAAFELRRVG